jgi:hypothetical protein
MTSIETQRKKITFWGSKREVMLPVNGVPHIFQYGQTLVIDLPIGINLPSYFVIEDWHEPEYKKVDPVVIKTRKKGVK